MIVRRGGGGDHSDGSEVLIDAPSLRIGCCGVSRNVDGRIHLLFPRSSSPSPDRCEPSRITVQAAPPNTCITVAREPVGKADARVQFQETILH
jgi:hypothetical protein